MFRLIDKYKKISSIVFLSAYFVFILISATHFHHYNLNPENCFNTEHQENSALSLDFLSDGATVCAVSHFSHSILNLSSSSLELFSILPKLDEKISSTSLSLYKSNLFRLTSPRAPPLFS